MAGAALVFLFNELNAGRSCGLPYPLGLVADHNKNVRRRNETAGDIDHVAQKRLSADRVQHLRPARLEPGPLARSHNHDGQL